MYKLMDTNTGLFRTSNRFAEWSKRGKVYVTLGHVKTRITNDLRKIVSNEIDDIIEKELGPYDWAYEYILKRERLRKRADIKELYALLRDKKSLKDLYTKYMPKNWKVVKIAEIIQPENIDIERLFT